MIRLASPEWLILLPLWIFLGFYWRHLRLASPLRALIVVLLLLVLVQPQYRSQSDGLDLWVLVDRSDSAAQIVESQLREWESLLEETKSRSDRVRYVDFAHVPMVRGENEEAVYTDSTEETNTATAIEYVLSLLSSERATRLLLFTDGFSAESLKDLGERLSNQGVPMDYRLLVESSQLDYQIKNFVFPSRVQPGEPFLITIEVAGKPDGEVPFSLFRDAQKLTQGKIAVRGGSGRVRLSDRLGGIGAHRYTVRIQPSEDAHPGNNQASRWIELNEKPRLLLLSPYQQDPLVGHLRGAGFDVQLVSDPLNLTVGSLSGARAVLINNLAAHQLPGEFLKGLDFFVRVQGRGLIMLGGENSFGSGGYFGSAVDPLLPVSMELLEEHRKLSVAMAIVVDRSGSMGMTVRGGSGNLTKMDLANEGVVQAVDILGKKDEVAVFAVDSEAYPVVPLLSVEENRDDITRVIRRISSGGGGIYVYNGLEAAWNALRQSKLGQRHIILFADAADAEQPGNYKTLIRRMVENNTTLSVIGLGSAQDSDAALLMDISVRGKGRLFFAQDPLRLPALFVQETVSVARSAFIDEAVSVKSTRAWQELAAEPLSWLTGVDGYNLSYLKKDASCALFSADEYQAPLVAFWHRGAGRSAAVSFPLAGAFSEQVRNWSAYGAFTQTLVRWSMGEEMPLGLGTRLEVNGKRLFVDLFYSDEWEEKLARQAPRIYLAEEGEDQEREVLWERISPGHYRSSVLLRGSRWLRGAIQLGSANLSFGPVSGVINPEWSFDRARISELQEVSRLSGGAQRLDLSKIWQAPRPTGFYDLRIVLLVILLLCFLVEILLIRLGWRIPQLAWSRKSGKNVLKWRPRHGAQSEHIQTHLPGFDSESETRNDESSSLAQAEQKKDEQERRNRFTRAKRRGE